MLSDDALNKLIKAGEIAKQALKYAEKIVKPGARLLDIASSIESYIVEHGGKPAFPVNIGVGYIAAHYTPIPGDELSIPDATVVKIDIGVHVDGYIADTAMTISFNPVYDSLLEATRRALEKALEVVRPGVRASEIGRVVEEVIRSHGYKPIKNLSGHSIDRYSIHSGVVIPNYNDVFNIYRLNPGVYAIEPFASNGAGLVEELDQVTIYALRTCRKPPSETMDFYNRVYSERQSLPFTPRWFIVNPVEKETVYSYLRSLSRAKCLVEYPVLVEKNRGIVAQFEHTVVVTRKDVIITTI